MLADPLPLTTQLNDQFDVPVARVQVAPPLVDTSTPLSSPPPESTAVAVIVEVGASASVEAAVATSPAWIEPGWAPMSANRLTVACFIRTSAASDPRSCDESRPHDHWTVPAPKTRAPLGWR